MSRRREGFTLIELMAVIAISGLLLALLLPAAQQARETARRSQCQSHVRQIVLALNSYHDIHGTWALNYGAGAYDGTNTGASWLALLLPFVDQPALHQQIQFGSPQGHPANVAAGRTVVPVYLCPSDVHGDGVMPNRRNMLVEAAVTNYKACLGSNWAWGTFGPVTSSTGRNANQLDGLERCNGIMCRGGDLQPTTTRLRDIRDGTSQTIAVGEAVPEWCWHTWWYWFNASTATCAVPLNYWRQPETTLSDWWENYSFASRHPGGGHFAMADGSARFMSESIDLEAYRALGTIAGAEVATDF